MERERLIDNLQDWADENITDMEVFIEYSEEGYQSQIDDHIIYIGPKIPNQDISDLIEYIKSNLPVGKRKFKYELFMFLHELGHLHTDNNFSKKEMKEYYKKVELINSEYLIYDFMQFNGQIPLEKRNELCNELAREYHMLSVEKAATDWAIEYMKNNDLSILTSLF